MSVLPVTGVATGALALAGLGTGIVGGLLVLGSRLGARRRRKAV